MKNKVTIDEKQDPGLKPKINLFLGYENSKTTEN